MNLGLCVYCSEKFLNDEFDFCPICKEMKSIDLKFCLLCANVLCKCANCENEIIKITGPDLFSAGC